MDDLTMVTTVKRKRLHILVDAPLMRLFIAVIWLIDPTLGMVALASALLLAMLAFVTELTT